MRCRWRRPARRGRRWRAPRRRGGIDSTRALCPSILRTIRVMKRLSLLLLIFASCATVAAPPPPKALEPARTPAPTPEGFMPVEWDASSGKLIMHISRIGEDFLYAVSLPAGVGSNPIGLDRGEEGG